MGSGACDPFQPENVFGINISIISHRLTKWLVSPSQSWHTVSLLQSAYEKHIRLVAIHPGQYFVVKTASRVYWLELAKTRFLFQ